MKQSLLWKISKKGKPDSYIFGTMHVKDKQVFSRIGQIEMLINEVDAFAAEYHLDKVQFVQQPSDLLIANGQSLSELLGEKKFLKMQKLFEKSFGIDLAQFEYYLPLLIINIIAEAILSRDYHLPLDLHLWKIAKSRNKTLLGVESYESQQVILKKILLKDQIKMLKEISKNPKKYRKNILKMAQFYQEEKIDLLYKNGKKSLGKYKNLLLKRRNFIMAEKFDMLANNEAIFFAVGAGHLCGSFGLLKLLKKRNWKLQPI